MLKQCRRGKPHRSSTGNYFPVTGSFCQLELYKFYSFAFYFLPSELFHKIHLFYHCIINVSFLIAVKYSFWLYGHWVISSFFAIISKAVVNILARLLLLRSKIFHIARYFPRVIELIYIPTSTAREFQLCQE